MDYIPLSSCVFPVICAPPAATGLWDRDESGMFKEAWWPESRNLSFKSVGRKCNSHLLEIFLLSGLIIDGAWEKLVALLHILMFCLPEGCYSLSVLVDEEIPVAAAGSASSTVWCKVAWNLPLTASQGNVFRHGIISLYTHVLSVLLMRVCVCTCVWLSSSDN